MAFKKFLSLIPALLLSRIAFVNSPLASPALRAPSTVPSPAGRSIVCSYIGTLGTSIPGFASCSFRRRLAAKRRCFFDLAIDCQSNSFAAFRFPQRGEDQVFQDGRVAYRKDHPPRHSLPSFLAALVFPIATPGILHLPAQQGPVYPSESSIPLAASRRARSCERAAPSSQLTRHPSLRQALWAR